MEKSFRYYFTPRFSDIDSYSIAHHSKYFCWFEDGRFFLLNQILNVGKGNIEEIKAPIIKLGCNYKKAIKFLDDYVIIITINLNEMKPCLNFKYKIMNMEETIIYAEAFTDHVFIDDKGNLKLTYPQAIVEKLHLLCEDGE